MPIISIAISVRSHSHHTLSRFLWREWGLAERIIVPVREDAHARRLRLERLMRGWERKSGYAEEIVMRIEPFVRAYVHA